MTNLVVAAATALWLGILTSISPCPLATNVAAVSYVGRSVATPWKVLFSGLLYTAGRMVVYAGLGVILVGSLLSAPKVSLFLQTSMNEILGPILIVVGMILIELIRINVPGFGAGKRLGRWVDALGPGGAFLLGAAFALSFCPVSAALFFGSLIPIAVASRSDLIVPCAYGAATGAPVLVLAALIAAGAKRIDPIFSRIVRYEAWMRRATGIVFILVGIYYCLVYIFRVFG
jgi:cytochrome c-type biogenesis protein